MGKVRNAYTAREKLAAVKFAEAHGNRAAGGEFGINQASIREWRKKKDRLKKLPKTKQAERDSKAHFPEVEAESMTWIEDQRRQGIAVSTAEIRLQASQVAQRLKISSFGCSVNWVYAFLQRNDLSIRRRTYIAQKLPEDSEEKLFQFQRFIIHQRKEFDYELSQIGNADQTPLTFDLPYQTTVSTKGSKTVTVNTTGNEKNRFTVMLACTADGGKLPPYIIFKRKTLLEVKWPEGVIIRFQDKGWMDDNLMRDWIKTVSGKRPGGYTKKSLLVLHSFQCHKSNDVKELLKEENRARLAIIPGGMTSILQPLDVSVNKPMKVLLQRKWNEWYAGDSHSFTATGRMRKPELQDVCQWIADAWQELDPSIIIKAFKKCCISNKMDGTKDDAMWADFVKQHSTAEDTEDNDYDEIDFAEENNHYHEIPALHTDQEYREMFKTDDEADSSFEGFSRRDIE